MQGEGVWRVLRLLQALSRVAEAAELTRGRGLGLGLGPVGVTFRLRALGCG